MKEIKTYSIFSDKYNDRCPDWEEKIHKWIKMNHPKVTKNTKSPDLLITLGGDGTIMDGMRNYIKKTPIHLGLNLGTLGFLASVEEEGEFLTGLERVFSGDYIESKRMALEVSVFRKGKTAAKGFSISDVVLQNLLRMSKVEVFLNNESVQNIHGMGVLISTGSGSTAYNLSAGGPIMPSDMKAFIVNKLFDHNIPTPPILVRKNNVIRCHIKDFRVFETLSLTETGEPVDMLCMLDGKILTNLLPGDHVIIKRRHRLLTIAELEKNYFFKKCNQKFNL